MAVADAFLGKVFEMALSKLGEVAQIINDSEKSGKELQTKLPGIQSEIRQIIALTISNPNASPTEIEEYQNLKAEIEKGFELVNNEMKPGRFDLVNKYQYGKEIQRLEENIRKFRESHGQLHSILFEKSAEKRLGCIESKVGKYDKRLGRMESLLVNISDKLTNDPNRNTFMLQQMDRQAFDTRNDHEMDDVIAAQQSARSTCQVPEMPKEFEVGLDNPVMDVKNLLLQNGVNIVGVTGMGGSGKTTLIKSLCKNPEVTGFFHKIVFLIDVSKSPNVICVLETIWDKIIGGRKPDFWSIEQARFELLSNLERTAETRPRPILIVLDDICPKSNLNDVSPKSNWDDLLFEAKGYKTIFTTREEFSCPVGNVSRREYKMPFLKDPHDVSLLCFSAFGQRSIPKTAEEDLKVLVKQVAAECKGLPLALKVTGSCLINADHRTWEIARKKLSEAKSISSDHDEQVFKRLQMSIDILQGELKECFLDLGAFPEGRKFKADYLLDIWVYVRRMEPDDAYTNLLKLAKRNLLNISTDPGSGAPELCFSQHDMMRALALRLGRRDGKRLFMPCKVDIPKDWLRNPTNRSSVAQFISLHTGAMAEKDWCEINFPEVEALALFFAGSESEYCLPTFLHPMRKLKVVFIYNYGSKRVTLKGLPSFSSFTHIKSVLLERLIVSPLYEDSKSWNNLEKLYVCLCEGLGNMTLWDKEPVLKSPKILESLQKLYLCLWQAFGNMTLCGKEQEVSEFPKILEINIDHCSDLIELPGQICNLTSLQRLSVTNCHLIEKLPEDLGELKSLKELRLYECPNLSMLPPTICKLQQLEFLDISLCRSLKDLPMQFEQLSNLRKLDMMECSGLKRLPKVLAKLRSLTHVICDKSIEEQWLKIKMTSAMPNLTIDAVEESFSLGWLDD